jgi:putative acetyltransferase
MEKLIIRPERPSEFQTVVDFVETAFQTAEVTGGTEGAMILEVRKGPGYIPELTFVAVEDEEIVGYLMLSRTSVTNGENVFPALVLGPVCIVEDRRNQGIGTKMILQALDKARDLGHKAVFLAGSPVYYHRFGFLGTFHFGIRCQHELVPAMLEAIMVKELVPGALKGTTGTVVI